MSDFFSRTGIHVVGGLLLAAIVYAIWSIGPVAVDRWFG
jgi:hypothetical protein